MSGYQFKCVFFLIRHDFVLLQCIHSSYYSTTQFRNVCVRLWSLSCCNFLVWTCTEKAIVLIGINMIMLNRFIVCNILSIFGILPSNRQHWRESAMNWRYSRCTDWKFYTWFHLNSTNGYIIAPFHHFPSLGDIKGSSLREWNKDEYIQLGTWAKLKSDHAYFCLSFTWKKNPSPFELTAIKASSKDTLGLFACWNNLVLI